MDRLIPSQSPEFHKTEHTEPIVTVPGDLAPNSRPTVPRCRRTTSVFVVFLCLLASGCRAPGQSPSPSPVPQEETVKPGRDTSLIDLATFRPDRFRAQEGVFLLAPDQEGFIGLCIPVRDGFERVGGGPPCERKTARIRPAPADEPYLLVRNLGLDTSGFRREGPVFRPDPDLLAPYGLAGMSRAFEAELAGDFVRWRFRTQFLPELLRQRIPGSGIHIHAGRRFPLKGHAVPVVWSGSDSALRVTCDAVVPRYESDGTAKGQLTLALDFVDTQGDDGRWRAMTLIVNLFHSVRASHREYVGTDTRTFYAGSYLGEGTQFCTVGQGTTRWQPWQEADAGPFVFTVTRQNLLNLIAAYRKRLTTAGKPFHYSPDPSDYRLRGASVRTEIVHLDRGYLDIDVRLERLALHRLP